MTDTTDKVAFAAAELLTASDAIASAAAEVDALRADAAEQMVVELREKARAYLGAADLGGVQERAALIAALSRTEAVAGRWVSAAERDAAIAARDEAVREAHRSDAAARCLGVDFARVLRDCTAAERARDEVGIQLAAAQERIKMLEEGTALLRGIYDDRGEPKWGAHGANHYHVPCDVIDIGVGCFLSAIDAVPGDALAPRINAALEASGIDTDNTPKAKPRAEVVQWEKRAEKAWSERDAALSTMLTLRAEVARLTAEVEAMRAVVEEADRVYTTCEPNAPMLVQHLGECLDALRARKVGG